LSMERFMIQASGNKDNGRLLSIFYAKSFESFNDIFPAFSARKFTSFTRAIWPVRFCSL